MVVAATTAAQWVIALSRVIAYAAAGADVLFAPGPVAPDAVRRIVAAVDRPVNVLARPGVPTIAELAAIGVARISVGGALAFAAYGAAMKAARELIEHGTFGYMDDARVAATTARAAFVARSVAASERGQS
jgi:2-methylisocitrate lyase-like PEP mutase family enzyme